MKMEPNRDIDSLFKEMYEQHRQSVYRYIYRHSNDPETALDLTQEVFLRLYSRMDRLRMQESGVRTAWLFRVAHNAFVDRFRRRSAEANYIAAARWQMERHPQREARQTFEDRDLRTRILMAIRRLTPELRRIFVGCELRNKGVENVRKQSGLSRRTFFRRLAAARETLQLTLAAYAEL